MINKVDNRTFFVVDGDSEVSERTYCIAPPKASDIRGADWQYSITYTKCLTNDIPTIAEMRDILKKKNIIGDTFDLRAAELSDILERRLYALSVATTPEEKRQCALEVSEARRDVYNWSRRVAGPMDHTCENIAEDSKLDFLTSCMIQYKNGDRVWKTFDEFLEDRNDNLTRDSRFNVSLYFKGLAPDFADNIPEAVAMREANATIEKEAEDALTESDEVGDGTVDTVTDTDTDTDTIKNSKKKK